MSFGIQGAASLAGGLPVQTPAPKVLKWLADKLDETAAADGSSGDTHSQRDVVSLAGSSDTGSWNNFLEKNDQGDCFFYQKTVSQRNNLREHLDVVAKRGDVSYLMFSEGDYGSPTDLKSPDLVLRYDQGKELLSVIDQDDVPTWAIEIGHVAKEVHR